MIVNYFFFFVRNTYEVMIQYEVDLIVIEGMGRSLHTNLNSKFKCESLKLAVIKVCAIFSHNNQTIISFYFVEQVFSLAIRGKPI